MTFSEAVFSIITQFLDCSKPSLAFLTTAPFRLPFARFARPSFKSPHRLFPFNYGHPRPPLQFPSFYLGGFTFVPLQFPSSPFLPLCIESSASSPLHSQSSPFNFLHPAASPFTYPHRPLPHFASSHSPLFPSNRVIPGFPGQIESCPTSFLKVKSFPASYP